MQSRQEREQDDVEKFRALSEALTVGMRVCCPGIIQSYDPNAITVTVQAAGKEPIRKSDGTFDSAELPLMVDVPVFFPRGGDFTLTFPIRKGDECIVVFADRCFDAWHQSGGIQEAVETRLHDLSNAFAIVGPFSQVMKITPPYSVASPHIHNVQLRHNDGDCWMEITPEKDINMKCRNMTFDIEQRFVVRAQRWDGIQQSETFYPPSIQPHPGGGGNA
ncbi:MAG: hypothetical protein LBQ42_13680 [Synergistaceae bacterium]|jgi:hypothetical protein|nr:hypothetical protein [Synergistaceae bacterium]